MTGTPAELWRKFTFSKSPPWAFWVGGILLASALAERTTGHLPLTRSSTNKIRTVTWTSVGLIVLAFVVVVAGTILDSGPYSATKAVITWVTLLLFLGALFTGVIGLFIVRTAVVPSGKILDPPVGYYEPLIELRHVHPAFVAAVQQRQRARASQYAAMEAPAAPPPPPRIDLN